MIQLSDNDADTQIHAKAKNRNQETFTLVAQDMSSPATIAFWIMLNIETAPEDKLCDALDQAIKMRSYPTRKLAD